MMTIICFFKKFVKLYYSDDLALTFSVDNCSYRHLSVITNHYQSLHIDTYEVNASEFNYTILRELRFFFKIRDKEQIY